MKKEKAACTSFDEIHVAPVLRAFQAMKSSLQVLEKKEEGVLLGFLVIMVIIFIAHLI